MSLFHTFWITHTDVYTVIDVAYHPDVLQAAEKDQVKKDQLIRMTMRCIEEQFQFTLSNCYYITKFRIKGSIQRMKQNLMGIQTNPADLREKMRNGKLMKCNGKWSDLKCFLLLVYILQTRNLNFKRWEIYNRKIYKD